MTITIHQPLGDDRTWRPEDIEAPEPIKYEIVDGNLVLMSPMKSFWHQTLILELAQVLNRAAPKGYKARPELTVGYFRPLAEEETLREPDVVVLKPGVNATRPRNVFAPQDVALVVEVESRSTRVVDRKDKVEEYARAGIPCYWRVEGVDAGAIVHVYEIDLATGEYALIRSIGPKDSFQMQRPYPVLIDPAELVADLAA